MNDEVKKYDVKNTLEVMKLGASISKAIKNAKADGKVDANDMLHLIPVMGDVGPAIDGISLVPKEIMDLDMEESELLITEAGKMVGEILEKEALIKKINAWIKAGLAILEAVNA